MCICSIKYCVFVQYNEWSTCNNVSFRRRVNMGFCIPPLSPFCSARPENCTQLGRNRILVLLCICGPTCVDLCTIVRVFVYEFLPSRIMVAKTTRLVTRAQYRSVVNVLDNVVQCMSYSLRIALASYSWWQNCELQTKPIESANANCSPRKKNVFPVALPAQMGRTYHFLLGVKNSTTKPEGLNRADCSVWKVDPTSLCIWQHIQS